MVRVEGLRKVSCGMQRVDSGLGTLVEELSQAHLLRNSVRSVNLNPKP